MLLRRSTKSPKLVADVFHAVLHKAQIELSLELLVEANAIKPRRDLSRVPIPIDSRSPGVLALHSV